MRGRCLLLAAALAASVARAGDDGVRLPDHAALIAAGQHALSVGDSAAAIDAFERAASAHDEAAELGLVRARLQAGDYRAAVALAAHVAGEHHEAEPAALYAALLGASGHDEAAQRVLAAAGRTDTLSAPGPAAWGSEPPSSARVIGTAVLVAADRAVMPGGPAAPRRLWLRNGLGQTVAVAATSEQQGLLALALTTPLPWDARLASTAREPFAGSPAYVVAYAPSATATPAWPRLHAGFLGREHQLGFEAPASAAGAPLLDASGRLTGITLPSAEGGMRWQSLPATASATAPSPRIGADEAYEHALHIALQVIAAD